MMQNVNSAHGFLDQTVLGKKLLQKIWIPANVRGARALTLGAFHQTVAA